VRKMRSAGRPGLAVLSSSPEVSDLAGEADLVVSGPEGIAALLTALAVQIGRADRGKSDNVG
jgi:trehalose 6-phosphate phosphatase